MSMYLMEDGTTKPHDEKIIELTKQRDDWKAKYLQQNRDLGCELRDPNGTIWDHAKEIEGKLVKANARMAEMIHIDELRAKADSISYKQEYCETEWVWSSHYAEIVAHAPVTKPSPFGHNAEVSDRPS